MMPGVSETVARVIIAEVGVDMDPVPQCGPSGLVGGTCAHVSTRVRASAALPGSVTRLPG